nr:hypothetical protein [Tanacetum cinerariifolium]
DFHPGRRSSELPSAPLLEDPYKAIRPAYLVGTDTEPKPFEGEAETLKSSHIVSPPSCHVEESEGFGTSGVRSTSSDSIAPLSPDHPLIHTTPALVPILCRITRMAMRVSPAMSPGLSAGIAEVEIMYELVFHKRFMSSYDSLPSSTLPVRKRYRGTSELILDTDSKEDEEVEESLDYDSEREDADDEGLTVKDEDPTAGDEGLAAGMRAPTLPSPEWSSGSFPIFPAPSIVPSPISSPMILLTVPSPIASPVATSTATIPVDEDQFIERLIGMSLEHEKERTVVAFRALWRPVLELEAWAGRVNTRMTDMSRTGYDDHRLVHDMLLQQTALQQELQEMKGHVTALE